MHGDRNWRFAKRLAAGPPTRGQNNRMNKESAGKNGVGSPNLSVHLVRVGVAMFIVDIGITRPLPEQPGDSGFELEYLFEFISAEVRIEKGAGGLTMDGDRMSSAFGRKDAEVNRLGYLKRLHYLLHDR